MTVFVSVQCGADKEQCEDTVLIGNTLICNDFIELTTTSYGSICVADGVGGNAGGQFASTFVTEQIKRTPPFFIGEAELRCGLARSFNLTGGNPVW